MKKENLFTIFILLSGFAFYSCTTIIEPEETQESSRKYIFYSTFESNDEASIKGWISPGPPLVKFASDAPPLGGKYSLLLKAADKGAVIENKIVIPEGKSNYRFTFWGKNSSDAGRAEIFLISDNEQKLLSSFLIEGKDWKYFSFKEEVTAAENDSIKIIVSGSSTNVPQGITYVDLFGIEKI